MSDTPENQEDPVSEYKRMLRASLERRPSGTRQKLAEAFGVHKSFVSQVINPSYKVPLPAQHIPALFRVCHFSAEEQQAFLDVYRRAHPAQSAALTELAEIERDVLRIKVPPDVTGDVRKQAEHLILDFAERVFALAKAGKQQD